MAWSDNDTPVIRVGQPTMTRVDRNGFWQILMLLPFLRVLLEYLQVRFVLKKLADLEQKILTTNLGTVSAVTKILQELQRLQKNFNHLLTDKINKKMFMELKKLAIKKSHASLCLDEPEITESAAPGTTHSSILQRLRKNQSEEAVHMTQTVPTTLYWRYAKDNMAGDQYSYASVQNPFAAKVKYGLSAARLIELLKNPQQTMLLEDSPTELLCHISFNRSLFNPDNSSNSHRLNFWQNVEGNNQLPKINFTSDLLHQVDEIFFETHDHFNQFKEILHNAKEAELLAAIFELECRQQIKISQTAAIAFKA